MHQAQKLSIPPSPTSLSLLRREPGIYQYSVWQGISIGVWVGQATLAAVRGIFEFGHDMRRMYPAGHSSVVFVLDQLPAPTPEARELLGRLFNSSSALSCTAVVLEGSGFWASGIRAMISNTHRAGTGNVRLSVGTTIDEVVDWFPDAHARTTGLLVDSSELRAILQRARAENAAAALGK